MTTAVNQWGNWKTGAFGSCDFTTSAANASIDQDRSGAGDTLTFQVRPPAKFKSSPFLPPPPPKPDELYLIVNNTGTAVGFTGDSYTVTKISGADGYNAGAVSSVGTAGGFALRIAHLANGDTVNAYFMGVNSDPTTDDNYTSIDYTWSRSEASGTWAIYESGANIASGLADATYCWIWRSGTTLYYGRGATLAIAQVSPDRTVTSVSATLYFDSACYSINDAAGVRFYVLTDVTVALTGQSLSAAQGTLAPDTATALTGQSVTVARGSVTAASDLALAGQALAVAQGSISPAADVSLTGQSTAAAQGSLTAASSVAITGQAVVIDQGTVVVNSADVTAELTGQSLASAVGSLAPANSLALTGQSLSAEQGLIAGELSLGLTGQGATVAQGALLTSTSLTLTGHSFSAAQGSLAQLFSAVLAGRSVAAGQGSVAGVISAYIPPPLVGWHNQTPAGEWTASDYARGAVWTKRPKGNPTW